MAIIHLLFARRSAAEVLLVALALGVGQIVAFGGVQGQAQLALEAAQMVLHEVRICACTVEEQDGNTPVCKPELTIRMTRRK